VPLESLRIGQRPGRQRVMDCDGDAALCRSASWSGLGQAEEDDQCSVQLYNMKVAEPPEVISKVAPRHRGHLVDHQEAELV
jgi:hypothetical protein